MAPSRSISWTALAAMTALAGCGSQNDQQLPRAVALSQKGLGPAVTPLWDNGTGGVIVMYTFTGSPDGAAPYGALFNAGDLGGGQTLIGTATAGGNTSGYGIVYELQVHPGKRTAQETPIYTFAGPPDGAEPYGQAIVTREQGRMQAIVPTYYGGASDYGAVITVTLPGSGEVAYSFTGPPDGAYPLGAVAVDSKCNIYGTTQYGGTNNVGTVWRMAPKGSSYTEQVLYSFAGGTDGALPYAGVTLGKNGMLYGTTYEGGYSGEGTVFAIDTKRRTDITDEIIHSFGSSGHDGAYPFAAVEAVEYNDAENLYGTTYEGGAHGKGTVYKLIPSGTTWTEQPIWSFGSSSKDGAYPGYGSVGLDSKGDIYGTTIDSTSTAGSGTFFVLVPSGSTYKEAIYNYPASGAKGSNPYAGPAADNQGNVYVPTSQGGTTGLGTVGMFRASKLPGRMAPYKPIRCG